LKAKEKEKEEKEREKKREDREKAKKEKAERPKKGLSSFMFFIADARKDIMAKNPTLKNTEILQEVGKRWATLPAEQKKKYETSAVKDKERYGKEMKVYEAKHPRPPKRPQTSFIAYYKANYEKIKGENPSARMTEVCQTIGKRWGALSEEQKKPYEKTAAASKEKYLKERKAFEDAQPKAH